MLISRKRKPPFLHTFRRESRRSAVFRRLINGHPLHLGGGRKFFFRPSDDLEVPVRLRPGLWNCNEVGAIFEITRHGCLTSKAHCCRKNSDRRQVRMHFSPATI